MDVWDVSRHRHYWRFKEPTEEITSGSFSPDGWRVLTVSQKIVRVWSLGFDSASWTFRNEGVVDWAAFAPDGVQVVTISCGHSYLWRTDCQQFRARLPEGDVSKAFFAPDGACVLLTGGYGTSLWNANGKGDCLFYVDKEDIRAMAFSHMRQ
jgi:WD40 repeat protein